MERTAILFLTPTFPEAKFLEVRVFLLDILPLLTDFIPPSHPLSLAKKV